MVERRLKRGMNGNEQIFGQPTTPHHTTPHPPPTSFSKTVQSRLGQVGASAQRIYIYAWSLSSPSWLGSLALM